MLRRYELADILTVVAGADDDSLGDILVPQEYLSTVITAMTEVATGAIGQQCLDNLEPVLQRILDEQRR